MPSATPLHILIISPHPSVHGGVSEFIETMKPQLQRCKVTSFWVGSVNDQPESRFSKLWRIITAPIAVALLVHRNAIDVVHINPSLDAKSILRDVLILLALRLTGFRKTLVYIHGWQVVWEQRLRRIPLLSHVTRWLLNGTGHIMVLAPEFKQGLEAMGIKPEKISFTHTMFDGAPIKAALSVSPFPLDGGKAGIGGDATRKYLATGAPLPNPLPQGERELRGNGEPCDIVHRGSGNSRRTILFMSRFVHSKGVYELLDAFATIAPDYQDVDLVFAGDGEEMQGLRERVATLNLTTRVHFPGYLRGSEKATLLCSCTVFALPTYFPEGMPVALLEAMAAGKPLLTSTAGGISMIASDPTNGAVLTRITKDTVEAGLRRLLGDASYCILTGRHNHDTAWAHFEAAIVTAEIETIYNHIATLE